MYGTIKVLCLSVFMSTFYIHAMEKSTKNLEYKSTFDYTKALMLYQLSKKVNKYSSFFEYALLHDKKEMANAILLDAQTDNDRFNLVWQALNRVVNEHLSQYLDYLLRWVLKIRPDFFCFWYDSLLTKVINADDMSAVQTIFSFSQKDVNQRYAPSVHVKQLFYMVNCNNIAIAEFFLKNGVDAHAELYHDGDWTLLIAIKNRAINMVSLLLKNNVDVNKINVCRVSPLSILLEEISTKGEQLNDYNLVTLLLKAGANPNIKVCYDYTKKEKYLLSYIASKKINIKFLELSLSYGINKDGDNAWYRCKDQPEKQQLLLNAGIGPNMLCENQNTVFYALLKRLKNEAKGLFVTLEVEEMKQIILLIKNMLYHGASIKASGKRGKTAAEYLREIEKLANEDFSLQELKQDLCKYENRKLFKAWQLKADQIREAATKTKEYPIDWQKENTNFSSWFLPSFYYMQLFKKHAQRHETLTTPLPQEDFIPEFKNRINTSLIDYTPIIQMRAPTLQTLLNN